VARDRCLRLRAERSSPWACCSIDLTPGKFLLSCPASPGGRASCCHPGGAFCVCSGPGREDSYRAGPRGVRSTMRVLPHGGRQREGRQAPQAGRWCSRRAPRRHAGQDDAPGPGGGQQGHHAAWRASTGRARTAAPRGVGRGAGSIVVQEQQPPPSLNRGREGPSPARAPRWGRGHGSAVRPRVLV
jgi:hypothetical protein